MLFAGPIHHVHGHLISFKISVVAGALSLLLTQLSHNSPILPHPV